MVRKKQQGKVTKYRRYSFFNIGTLLFGTVFIYMIISVFMYLTDKHVTPYEVKKGTITGNYRYHALALREEVVVNALQSGSVRYLEREGVKTSYGSVVCAVNESGSSATASVTDFDLNKEDEIRFQNMLSSFTIDYSPSAFQRTYDIKAGVENTISEIVEEEYTGYISTRNQCVAPESGFVVYHVDGFEQVTEENLVPDMFIQSDYKSTNLRTQEHVVAGNPVFKLVTSEDWYLYFPIDSKLMTELADTQKIRFRFLKDNVTFSAPFTMLQVGTEIYGRIRLDNSLVRYATDRFLEIELVMNKVSGLKIPTSAIVERMFYRIPEEYAIKNENTTKEIALKVEHFASDGSSVMEFVTANVYRYSDGYYLVDCQLFEEGDVIHMENASKQVQLMEKDVQILHGVYNINKGYAVFREITVIDENEEYCIVESNNIYGLASYDYIVLNASDVTEDQIVY